MRLAPARQASWRARAQDFLARHVRPDQSLLPVFGVLPKPQLYFVIASMLLFAGVYTDIGIQVGESSVVPMVSAWPGLIMMAIYPGVVTPRLVRMVVATMVTVALLGIITPELKKYLVNRIIGIGQTGFSITAGYFAYYALMRFGRVRLHKFLTYFIPIYLFFIVLELAAPPFRSLVTSYLGLYPRDYNFDVIADRESRMGGYRPKLFTSETSYVAMTLLLVMIGYVWSGIKPGRYLWAGVYIFAALALVRSPIIGLSLLVLFVNVFTDRTLGRNRQAYAIWMTFGLVVAGAALALFGSDLIAARLEGAASGADYSTTYRTYGSLAVALAVLQKYPVFGVGVGSLMPVKEIIFKTYLKLGVPLEAVIVDWNLSINNALASFLIYFGLLGTTIAGLMFWRLFTRDVDAPRSPVVMALLVYSITCGAVYTPKYVIAVMVLFAVAKLRPSRADIQAYQVRKRRQPA